ncbi:MAG: hypothetical protein A3J79_08555 [Elusimicrobia bacterium RIFOXYB2_FULL_62_6]|nr:MAG: hypothetical protein A3J79_08555 [Elusimicrobia bacterium RIFOXYB2_FULL_62_6]
MKNYSFIGEAKKGLLIAALFCLAAPALAGDLTAEEAAALAKYETAISSADPAAAKKFLEDAPLADKLKLSEPERAAELTAKAQAVTDLAETLDRTWRSDQEMELSRALSLRIDFNKPLVKVGIGPAPEPLLAWMAKYRAYSAVKTLTVKKAIREFETVFGTSTVSGKAGWNAATIRERNALLSEKAAQTLDGYINNETRTDKAFQTQLKNTDLFRFLDATGQARLDRYLGQMSTVEQAKAKLGGTQATKLNGQPIEQQMYLLGGMFDGSKDKGAVSIERKIDSGRQSRPGETISYQNNQLLSGMLRTSLQNEVKGSAAGDKVLKFYNSGAKLDVAIESCQGCYAKYEPSTGKIIFDSEMIQQYMRVNNVTADTLIKDRAQLAALTKYISPMFVHEATHQMQHDWAAKAHIYKPYTQEDEIESSSMEALYMTEKMKRDKRFKDLFTRMENNTTYAQKRMQMMDRFNRGGTAFENSIRQVVYFSTPSFDAASSQILSAISAELQRRNAMSAADRAATDAAGAGLNEAMGMTVQELSGGAGNIKTDALKKIQDDLLHKAVYTGHYESAADWTGSMLGTVRTSAAPRIGAVPAL